MISCKEYVCVVLDEMPNSYYTIRIHAPQNSHVFHLMELSCIFLCLRIFPIQNNFIVILKLVGTY